MRLRYAPLLLLTLGLLFTPVQAQDAAACEAGFRLVEHALGESCIPEHPQRVFTLDLTLLELLLIAEQQPAAYSGTLMNAYLRMHPEFEPTFEALKAATNDVGYPPNAEAILDAQPDLIIVPRDTFTESLYPQLSEAVPTVVYEPAPGDWRGRLIFGGEVLGLDDLVADLLADYDARVAELQTVLGDTAGETEISLVRTFPDQIGLLLDGTAAATLLHEVGLARPESQSYDYDYVLDVLDGRPEVLISEEELPLADGDVIFVFGDASALADNPLWNALAAVEAGHAYTVGYYWWGDSLLSAHDMLDDLFQYVAGVDSTTSNPFEDGITPPIEVTPEATSPA